MPLLDSPFAQLDLIRQPEQHNDPLQAFDAADEYLLSHLAAQQPTAATRVLVADGQVRQVLQPRSLPWER